MGHTMRETKSILLQSAIVSNSENNFTYLMTFKQRPKTHKGTKWGWGGVATLEIYINFLTTFTRKCTKAKVKNAK